MPQTPSPPDLLYFDNSATTRVAPEVREAMLPFLGERWGNPNSAHGLGVEARLAVERARRKLAKLLNCQPAEVVFTSGGTESDCLAIQGAALAAREAGKGNRVATLATEHKAVLESMRFLERYAGFEAEIIGVGSDGRADLAEFEAALRPGTVLASAMLANNETGVLQPIRDMAALCRERGILLHSDGAQAVGHVPVDVRALGVDLLTVAAHKFHGPKGAGALFVREGAAVAGLQSGGGQEGGLRGGTENVAGIAGLGAAADLARKGLEDRRKRHAALRDRLWEGLRGRIPGAVLNADGPGRLPHVLSFAVPGANAQKLVADLSAEAGLCCSAGSACSADAGGQSKASHVLLAMGLGEERARGSLRLSLGRYTTDEDIARAIELIPPVVARQLAEASA